MASAVAADADRGTAPAGESARTEGPARTYALAAPAKRQGTYFGGTPTVGTFFSSQSAVGSKDGNTYCTASVVHSKTRDLILTAGHCSFSLGQTHQVFVPKYQHGQGGAQQELGIFPIKKVFKDPRYVKNTKGSVSDLDFGFARVGLNSKGQKLQDATGAALKLTPTGSYKHKNVTVIGYPAGQAAGNHDQKPLRCTANTARLPRFRQMEFVCGGYYGGVSGGPWITDFNPENGTGNIIGNTGGYNGGGNDQNVDWLIYSPVHDRELQALYDDAVAGHKPSRPEKYSPVNDSPGLPGNAGTWTHAKLMASGNHTGRGSSGDLTVVWTDGEVTLYKNNHGRFEESRLKAKNSTWTHARSITSGDFAGRAEPDLMVLWTDGEVTLYPDVSTNGLSGGTEIQMAPPKSTWQYARQITAGRFKAKKYITDLTVRWKDGETSLYTSTGPKSFGTEHTLVKKQEPNWWHYPRQITSGQYADTSGWDLMVRWKDGELDSYTHTSPAGLGSEARFWSKNSTWTYARAMTTGDYTGNGRTDDVIVRWADGETTLYTGTRAGRIGTEHRLVSPHSLG
ncbi:trypsin-like serine protease [Streptomyces lasiicapitis]|uniref:trypsin-like serine peptidase n=1 Tax=Streptomyces lasiicapitis TaxID=1923961 RepID=UPI00331B548F